MVYETTRASGMAGDKDQVVFFDACRCDHLQIVVEMHGLIVFIDAEETDIQIVARVSKLSGIAAKERDLEFRARTPGAHRCTFCSCKGYKLRPNRA